MLAIPCDVTDSAQIDHLVAETQAFAAVGLRFHHQCLVDLPAAPMVPPTWDAWRSAIDLTLMSVVHLVKAALPHLQSETSISHHHQRFGEAAYRRAAAVQRLAPGRGGPDQKRWLWNWLRKTFAATPFCSGWTHVIADWSIFEYRAEVNGTAVETERAKITTPIPMGRMAWARRICQMWPRSTFHRRPSVM
ncbi:MAG: SDR family oxidoreductase [Chloroflexi bacterium]|nr:SDR family oxidoreductase [Chloroflexota bacterium]